jgi:Na+/phosphate symporter
MTGPSAEAIQGLFQDTLEMLRLTWASFRRHDAQGLGKAEVLARDVHQREKDLTRRLLGAADADTLRLVPGHLERIGDAVEGLIRSIRRMEREGTVFTERGVREVDALFERTVELLECARDLARTGNRVLARHVRAEGPGFHALADDYARAHEERLIQGVCMPHASSAYLAILDYLREIVRHVRRIAERYPAPPDAGGLAPALDARPGTAAG